MNAKVGCTPRFEDAWYRTGGRENGPDETYLIRVRKHVVGNDCRLVGVSPVT